MLMITFWSATLPFCRKNNISTVTLHRGRNPFIDKLVQLDGDSINNIVRKSSIKFLQNIYMNLRDMICINLKCIMYVASWQVSLKYFEQPL